MNWRASLYKDQAVINIWLKTLIWQCKFDVVDVLNKKLNIFFSNSESLRTYETTHCNVGSPFPGISLTNKLSNISRNIVLKCLNMYNGNNFKYFINDDVTFTSRISFIIRKLSIWAVSFKFKFYGIVALHTPTKMFLLKDSAYHIIHYLGPNWFSIWAISDRKRPYALCNKRCYHVIFWPFILALLKLRNI